MALFAEIRRSGRRIIWHEIDTSEMFKWNNAGSRWTLKSLDFERSVWKPLH